MSTVAMARPLAAAPSITPAISLQRKCDCRSCSQALPRTAHCGERTQIPERAEALRVGETVPDSVAETLHSPGQSLPEPTRSLMEHRFEHDFSSVRVHADAAAAASAKDVAAHAYTVGRHIVFGESRYSPPTSNGIRLLAHELAHTIQQGSRPVQASSPIVLGAPHDSLEHEADAQAARIEQGKHATPWIAAGRATDQLQREPVREPVTEPPQQEPTVAPLPKCGPDATDWFVRQVNTAMTDPAVLRVKADLTLAGRFAAIFGLTVAQLGEAGGTLAVLGQESALGARAPARTPDARSQLAAGSRSLTAVTAAAPGALSPPTTITPFPSPSTGAAIGLMTALASAALGWRALVNHGARYDFKAHTMNHPRGTSCPDDRCPPGEVGIITLCPGSNPQNCYESDVPGNLFYALIGRFVGWSELTLQLGSQYAELTDVTPRPARPVVTWDTPDDTAAISLGFRLPLPMTRGALCGSVGPARASLVARHGCQDCLDLTSAAIR